MVNINLISGIVHLHGIYIRTSWIQQIMNLFSFSCISLGETTGGARGQCFIERGDALTVLRQKDNGLPGRLCKKQNK